MLKSAKAFVKTISSDNGGHIPDDIKVGTEKKVKVVPDEYKSHSGDMSRCRIVPGENVPDIEAELNYEGLPLDSGEQIKIVPSNNK